ncbi:MAG: hypothetical protein IKT40_01505 [Bacilli bacterium]|nr:hypothetical protein [Bacilli bacterium]
MKEIRSSFVKESLLDYENLANSLKESTSNAVRDLLAETVRETYNQILNESEDDYEVENMDDTNSEDADMNADVETESMEDEGKESEVEEVENEESEEVTEEPAEEEGEEVMDSENDEWAEFEKYQVSDDEYDFSKADDEEIVKVYKLLKDTDEVLVNVDKDTNKVELKDNQTGAEYLIDLGASNDETEVEENPMASENELELNDMNESIIFEVALNEYDSNVGYTDNYQKKDVMTNPGMKEPGKNVNDWDAGVPKSTSKPWAGKGDNAPFDKTVKEEEEMTEEQTVEEATNVGGFVQQNSTSKSHVPNSNGRKARNSSVASVKTKETTTPRYSTNESKMMQKVDKILKENQELKEALGKFKNVLQEAAVVNVNLGQIIKLISENSTTKAEKQEIIERFGNEAKTVEQSKQLYETISKELKKNNTMNISEEKQFTTNSSKMINETQIYKSKDLMDSLDLMHRLCK